MGCDHEIKILRLKPKENVDTYKIHAIDGSVSTKKIRYTTYEPYYQCHSCGRTRTLSDREKDELHETMSWE